MVANHELYVMLQLDCDVWQLLQVCFLLTNPPEEGPKTPLPRLTALSDYKLVLCTGRQSRG